MKDERIEYEKRDISYNTDGRWGFGYRAAALIVRGGRLLLQSPTGVDEYAVPGGQVMFGETAAQAIERELTEEIGVKAAVGEFLAVGELFFPVGERTIHQLFLQFAATLPDDALTDDVTPGLELGRDGGPKLRFEWVGIDRLREIPLYPPQIADVVQNHVKHYLYEE